MPEGHTLHRLAHQLNRLFIGRPWRVTSPQGRFAAGAALLNGRTPEHAEAWGKHLFVHAGEHIWQVHLGLYGAFSFFGDQQFKGAATLGAPRLEAETFTPEYDDDDWLVPEPPQGAVRARIQTAHGWADLRGPATCTVLNPAEQQKVLDRLGPDPLRTTTSGTQDEQAVCEFARRLSTRRISIAAALMDQAVIAGVGNIYRAEALFMEGINPDTPAKSLTTDQVQALWQRIGSALQDGVREGSIITLRNETLRPEPEEEILKAAEHRPEVHDYRAGRAAATGLTIRRHWVYQHQGTPCLRCGETLLMRELQGRRLYWCPGCQS